MYVCVEQYLRHVLRCHLLAKNIANIYGVTYVQEEVMLFGTFLLFVTFVVSKSFDSVVVSVLLRMFMLRLVYSHVT